MRHLQQLLRSGAVLLFLYQAEHGKNVTTLKWKTALNLYGIVQNCEAGGGSVCLLQKIRKHGSPGRLVSQGWWRLLRYKKQNFHWMAASQLDKKVALMTR